jgi:hypothetical protein
MCTNIAPDIVAAFKVRSVTDEERVKWNERAYIVLDFSTSLGPFRARKVRIRWSSRHQRLYVRWEKFPTGRKRDGGRKEQLDLFGPLDNETRATVERKLIEALDALEGQGHQGTAGSDPAQQGVELEARLPSQQRTDASEEDGPAAVPVGEAPEFFGGDYDDTPDIK